MGGMGKLGNCKMGGDGEIGSLEAGDGAGLEAVEVGADPAEKPSPFPARPPVFHQKMRAVFIGRILG